MDELTALRIGYISAQNMAAKWNQRLSIEQRKPEGEQSAAWIQNCIEERDTCEQAFMVLVGMYNARCKPEAEEG
jgi:hypothetical protein